MRIARSARMRSILGASLAAMIVPGLVNADIESKQLVGINSTSVLGIDSSSALAIDSSSALGLDSSSILGIDSSSVLAIDSSSGLGIDSSSGLGIDSSSGLGIDSSSGLGIDSSSGLGIDSSSVLAIDSSSGLGIDSSSGLGIDSSSGLGIDSSSGLGIDSSSGLGIDSSSGLGIDSSSALGIDSSSVRLLAGPIEAINFKENSFTSLGQTVSILGRGIRNLRVGDFVAVSGSIVGAGRITANQVIVSSEQYIPGATQVFVTGIPTSVDFGTGVAKIGGLSVDYTASLGGNRFDGIGAAITVIGIQPAPGGTMLSDRVMDQSRLFFVQ